MMGVEGLEEGWVGMGWRFLVDWGAIWVGSRLRSKGPFGFLRRCSLLLRAGSESTGWISRTRKGAVCRSDRSYCAVCFYYGQ